MSRITSAPQYKASTMQVTQLPQQHQIIRNSQYIQYQPQQSYYQPQYHPTQTQIIHNTSNIQHSKVQSKSIHYADSNYIRSSPMIMEQTDFLVYCPVCKVDYFNSQVNSHMRRHYVGDSYHFKMQDKDLSQTAQSLVSYNQTISYPLVQPLQFYTSELDQVAKGDRYKFIINQNFDDFQDDVQPQQRSQIHIQTAAKPPLQYAKQKTNLYNCLDNMVNEDSFTAADVFKNNQGLASKRELSQWEYLVLGNKK